MARSLDRRNTHVLHITVAFDAILVRRNRRLEPMDSTDLNLLRALDALLAEGSVTGAARRLGLSTSAMSRTLARLREATGDPLLVRAGRRLVPTPHAIALRERVPDLAREVQTLLSPARGEVDIATLDRTFTLRTSEGFMARFAAPLVGAVVDAAPRVCLRFAPKPRKEADPLRQAQVDLEIGVLDSLAPELLSRCLFRDRFVGAARIGHPLLARAVTARRYAACGHVVASRKGQAHGPVDDALAKQGLRRNVRAVVPGFPDALAIARESDLIALVPASCLDNDGRLRDRQAVVGFELPVATPRIEIAAMWHPRMDADPAHRWLRDTVAAVCRAEHVDQDGRQR